MVDTFAAQRNGIKTGDERRLPMIFIVDTITNEDGMRNVGWADGYVETMLTNY